VHSDQIGFIKGRCIAMNFLYAMEIVQCCHKRGAPAIALKVDFTKAFVSVDLTAMDAILAAKGSPLFWRQWITTVNTNSSTTIVLNGVPGKRIWCRHGFRKGDPLSAYLFILVADLLQQMLTKLPPRGEIQHPQVADLSCPMLQYAHDTHHPQG
jgi:hypothetical protein